MRIITKSEEIKEYRDNKDHINQSQLKLLIEGLHKFKSVEEPELYYEEKEHFIIGSAVDVILTQGREEFDKSYYISKLDEKPSDTVMSIWNEVYDLYKNTSGNTSMNTWDELILIACNNHNYYSNLKDDTRIKKIYESKEYLDELLLSGGKQIISKEENDLIREYVDKILYGKYTHFFFDDIDIEEIDYYFQFPIYFMVNGVQCKALLDMMIVDHVHKTIQPIDIKTSSESGRNFYKTARKYRYDIQSAFYQDAVSHYTAVKDKRLEKYRILPFKFIVVNRYDANAIVFNCSAEFLQIGRRGLPSFLPGRSDTIFGYLDLVNEYKYYLEKGFEEEMLISELGGNLELFWNV